MKCDFCDITLAKGTSRWVYDMKGETLMMTDDVLLAHSDRLWAACDACHDLITKGNRERLAQRSAASLPASLRVDVAEATRAVKRIQEVAFWIPWAKVSEFTAPVQYYG